MALFRQLFDRESCTYTYLLADTTTNEALLIDPVLEHAERDAEIVAQLGLTLVLAANTHCHADHVTGTGRLKELTGCRSVISAASGAQADQLLAPGDSFGVGAVQLRAVATPGHTEGCMTFVLDAGAPAGLGPEPAAFTGDALLIRGCGRTDFQGGSAAALYDSVHGSILSLPAETRLFPAHDYKGRTMTTVAEELAHNPRLTKTREEFIELMGNLGLPHPAKIDEAVPRNLYCGSEPPPSSSD